MPPTTTYSKNDILEAAYTLVSRKGIEELTARKVASNAGSSTAPVYSYFASMDELRDAIFDKALNKLRTYIAKSYTNTFFLNIAVGICYFARDEQHLFRSIFLTGNIAKKFVDEFFYELLEKLTLDPRFKDAERDVRLKVLHIMWNQVMGMSAMLVTGLWDDPSDATILEHLEEAGNMAIGIAEHKDTLLKTH